MAPVRLVREQWRARRWCLAPNLLLGIELCGGSKGDSAVCARQWRAPSVTPLPRRGGRDRAVDKWRLVTDP